jgi:hypothetical protein
MAGLADGFVLKTREVPGMRQAAGTFFGDGERR